MAKNSILPFADLTRYIDLDHDSHTLDFIWKGLTIRFHFAVCMFIRQNVVRSELV